MWVLCEPVDGVNGHCMKRMKCQYGYGVERPRGQWIWCEMAKESMRVWCEAVDGSMDIA
jgi:hypothetical protein